MVFFFFSYYYYYNVPARLPRCSEMEALFSSYKLNSEMGIL